MNANDVLIDILEDNRRRLLRLMDTTPDNLLTWQLEKDANTIGVTIWHMARILDVFLIHLAQGLPPENETWFAHGWAEQSGYDPRGIGQHRWGMLTGYMAEEAAAIPPMSKALLIGYLDDVYDTVKEYLLTTSTDRLLEPADGFEGKYNTHQCIQMALLDNIRHLGEVFAIQSSYERTHG